MHIVIPVLSPCSLYIPIICHIFYFQEFKKFFGKTFLKAKTVALHKCQVLPIILSCKANYVMLIDCFTPSSAVSIFFQCKKDFP